MKTPARKSPRPRRPAPADLHHEVRHFTTLMRCLGGWPVQPVDTQGATGMMWSGLYEAAPWRGWRMLLCYAQALSMALLMAACLRSSFSQLLSDSETYIERVILVLHVIYETTPLAVPVLHWHTGRELADYFNAWTRFQASWRAVTGAPLRFRCGRRSKPLAIFLGLFSLITPVCHARISPHLFIWKVPLYWHVVAWGPTQALLWRALHAEVAATAIKMPHLFRHHLHGGGLTGDAVRGYCMLWLRLRALTQSLGDAWGAVMLHCFLVMLLMSMTSSFGMLYALRQGVWRRVASTFITILTTALIIRWICSPAGRAVRHVSREMLLELLTTPMRHLDEDTTREVMRFIQVLQEKPVSLKLRRFVVVNRELGIAAGATVATYIVVLTQLSLGMSVQESLQGSPSPSPSPSPSH